MAQDKLVRHRCCSRRENPNSFKDWLSSNCHMVVDPKKLQEATKDKEAQIKKILQKSS